MAKLRRMLGDINSPECIGLMRLIETQSKQVLAAWAVSYAKDNYLGILEEECPGSGAVKEAVAACEEYLSGNKKLSEIKPAVKAAVQTAREISNNPVGQAAARAVSTACGTVQTPTNALGFLFYGAAAAAYSEAGLEEKPEVYEKLASEELKRALVSLKAAAVPDEPNPVKINWNC